MESCAQESHDSAATGHHIANLSTFVSHLTDAVSEAWPARFSTGYRTVKVLLISWEQDDLGVDAEIRPLASVFSTLYHYDTEVWKIPTARAAMELSKKVTNVLDAYGHEGNLLIIYYGGHARLGEQPGGSPIWAASRYQHSPTVQSSVIHSLLGEVDCDVLLLYDACHAIQAGEASRGKGVVEHIAACGFESIAAEVGPHSFTNSLIQELAHATQTTEWLSVVELHRRLINRLQAWMPSVRFTDNTDSVVQVNRYTGRPEFERPRRRTPIYCFISKKPRTIILSPLPPPQLPPLAEEPFIYLNPPATTPEMSSTGPGIFLGCRLRDQSLDIQKWKGWLLNAPSDALNIEISAIYPILRPGSRSHPSSSAKEWGTSSMWPDIFAGDRTAVYAAENEQYCLKMAERHPDETLSMAERIVRVFAEDVGDPSMRYICDEIEAFCAPASFERLLEGQNPYAKVVALLDERSPPTGEGFGSNKTTLKLLTSTQLFNTLSSSHTSPLLIETESKIDHLSPRRRLLYLTNIDATSTLAVISTASRTQALFLKEFIYKHITFQSGMSVKFQPSGSPCFQISFHLPFFAWRRGNKVLTDARLGGEGRPLRSSKNVTFLCSPTEKGEAYIYEAQISCMIVGVDNRHWTAYGIFDTYHDGGESKHDVQVYEPMEDEIPEDPLTGGRYASDRPIWMAREYFLRVLLCCIAEVKAEWQTTGSNLLRPLKPYTTNAKDADWRKIQQVSHQTVQLLEQFQQVLYGTVSAWEAFRKNDLSYFDLDNWTHAATHDPRVMVKHIENDIRDLRVLGETLARESAMFKSYTAAVRTDLESL
ncbi:hypothetical protein B0T21DRAFT_367008 [Apiosordaria backusii]|uniref:Uncharacterized protein n=1 Tax=Apiosordaria backusii TaxID=314023 RepID=A0AA40BLJ4_9PEZI|nr:hypothetical protein B0T21DRAFT_367008 [Apiosordaria backusii]